MRNRYLPSGWLLSTVALAALTAVLANVARSEAQTGSADPASRKNYAKDPVFHLPISIQEKMRSSIREVQLFMKVGSGDWQCREMAPPTQKAFTFRAPADGEYWFTLVTVDNRGVMLPSDLNRLTPADIVMVVVDTQPPAIEVRPQRAANGDVQLHCVVNDANPDPSSVKITCHIGDQGNIALEPLQGMPGAFRVPGPETLASPLHVTVADLAGNTTTKEINLQDQIAKLWQSPQSDQPVAQKTQSLPSQAPPVPAGALSPKNPPTVRQQEEANNSNSQNTVQVVSGATITQTNAQVQEQQPVSHSVSTGGAIPHQYISTKRAALEYRIDQVGPSGVGKVEVWVSTDQGASWKRHCEDADRHSPAEFELPGDGLYGVRVVVTNGNGFGGKAPIAGEQPQLWIEVDTLAPVVQFKEVEPNPGNGTVDLRWTANDKNLGSEPINLFYAARREGPWQPVARNLKNDGLYKWTMPRDLGQFFLRIEATDMAGNVARCETPTAIVLDMTEPRASVIGVTGVQSQPTQVRGN